VGSVGPRPDGAPARGYSESGRIPLRHSCDSEKKPGVVPAIVQIKGRQRESWRQIKQSEESKRRNICRHVLKRRDYTQVWSAVRFWVTARCVRRIADRRKLVRKFGG
jgi:hypothetical protein